MASQAVPAPDSIEEMLDEVVEAGISLAKNGLDHNNIRAARYDAARSEILALVSRLRSQVERMKAEQLTAEEAWAILDQPVSPWGLKPELVEKLRRLSDTGA